MIIEQSENIRGKFVKVTIVNYWSRRVMDIFVRQVNENGQINWNNGENIATQY